jgi:hypothetical protein
MKRSSLRVAVLCVVVFAVVGRGQTEPQESPSASSQPPVAPAQLLSPPPAPATVLEARSLAKGMLLVKGYTDIATLAGDDDSSIRTTAVEIAQPTEKFYGVVFTIRQGERSAREAIAYLDEDEIGPLGEVLDALGRLERGASPMADFEGHYRTRGNLEITNYDRNGARVISVRAVQVLLPSGEMTWASARFSVARLVELRQQLAAAKQVLDRSKSPNPAPEGGNK